jgi:hypothetical protein
MGGLHEPEMGRHAEALVAKRSEHRTGCVGSTVCVEVLARDTAKVAPLLQARYSCRAVVEQVSNPNVAGICRLVVVGHEARKAKVVVEEAPYN